MFPSLQLVIFGGRVKKSKHTLVLVAIPRTPRTTVLCGICFFEAR